MEQKSFIGIISSVTSGTLLPLLSVNPKSTVSSMVKTDYSLHHFTLPFISLFIYIAEGFLDFISYPSKLRKNIIFPTLIFWRVFKSYMQPIMPSHAHNTGISFENFPYICSIHKNTVTLHELFKKEVQHTERKVICSSHPTTRKKRLMAMA